MLVHGLSSTFSHALVRPPCATFARGLTESNLGPPDLELALRQHADYCEALVSCGLSVQVLEPDDAFPDSTFVEDTALLFPEGNILCRPGAASRLGETKAIERVLAFDVRVQDPGTVDGGDVCVAEKRVFVGLSERTNRVGFDQLSKIVGGWGYEAHAIDLGSGEAGRVEGLLHLKSGMSYLGEDQFVLDPRLRLPSGLISKSASTFVEPDEAYAANCLRINDALLMPLGYPKLRATLESKVARIIELDMSEFQKMDGGLSCLSLRW